MVQEYLAHPSKAVTLEEFELVHLPFDFAP